MRLTFRIEDDELWASDDEGRSRRLDPRHTEHLIGLWEEAPLEMRADGRTAGVLADLGQARMARPHPTGRAVSAQTRADGRRLPLGRLVSGESRRLAEVLNDRHSSRTFGPTALTEIATILMRASRLRDWTFVEDGYQASHRATPSAGGRHPFDLHVVAANEVDGLKRGEYLFDPASASLAPEALAGSDPAGVLTYLGDRLAAPHPPTAAIFLVAHLDRTLSRYPAGMSLAWRDAGALLQTLHLCATDLALRSCIVGTCGVLHDDAQGPVIDMGALALGGSPR
jgi:SagB-type dehydrogenase family enzyme